ncbi:MAG: quinolinate synthase NadA [Clostridiales bacterium]|jgi:quinolinate synthase|nr:quinolinate synthase NadA [Clostridiales bacterium]
MSIQEDILRLKREKNAVVLAHYYVDGAVQDAADFVGDSYYLSAAARETDKPVIIFCGVRFMAESAKIMNPEKTVVLPDELSDCPMARMTEAAEIAEVRAARSDLSVVCYINSTAEIKALSDVCVTSSNALKIIPRLPSKNIFFIPDQNLAKYAAAHIPEKNFIFGSGYCHVHTGITPEDVSAAKTAQPDALVLAHPECTEGTLALADYIGSTSGIINFAEKSEALSFIICTEAGVLRELKRSCPGKRFFFVGRRQFCPNMKSITLEKLRDSLDTLSPRINMEEALRLRALRPLEAMHALAKRADSL